MSEWQSIETAPKDGTHVLLWGTLHNMLALNNKMHVGKFACGWWVADAVLSNVTHWQPLPTPPVIA